MTYGTLGTLEWDTWDTPNYVWDTWDTRVGHLGHSKLRLGHLRHVEITRQGPLSALFEQILVMKSLSTLTNKFARSFMHGGAHESRAH